MKEKKLINVDKSQSQSQKDQKLDDENAPVPFTARLMAYYRAKECENDSPLIVDPFSERLAGDLTSYINKHGHFAEMDYPIVRSYYIEKNLLTPWCNTHEKSQIVLLGAGLDTRAYRFKPLQTNTHTIFEIDFSSVIRYKEEILQGEQPLCGLVRISADISNLDWSSHLIKSGFSSDIPTFWVLEGLVYYLEQEVVASLLKKAAEISAENSQIFVDICIPILAELNFGPFSKYFKWGLDKKDVPSFFAATGWNVSCSFADNHDQGRDVGQKGLIFVHGVRAITGCTEACGSLLHLAQTIEESDLQAFTIEFTKKIIPEIEGIVEAYERDPEVGLSAYLDFVGRVKPSLEKIAKGLRDHISLGRISPRLLRDPLSVGLMAHRRPPEEEEAHVAGYLKAILQLVYCGAKGLEGEQFFGTSLHEESLRTQNVGKINIIPSLVQIVKQEIVEVGD